MAVVDISGRSLILKIVYYGCALGGKTTNLVTLHRLTDPDGRQGLVSIATNDDRTLFFDLLPMELGQVGGLSVKVKLYTVPGQVHYELTRRQVLGGADGVVLVIDSSPGATKPNAWAHENLRYNLRGQGIHPDRLPTVLQWNKRDLPDARPVHEMQAELNTRRVPAFEAVATVGTGVIETFAEVLKRSIKAAYEKAGRPVEQSEIDRTVNAALSTASEQVAHVEPQTEPRGQRPTFEHRFDMDDYRKDEADHGRDRRVVDQESLLSEAVNTNMMLAEKLDSLNSLEVLSDRRARMMSALSFVTPMLADPAQDVLPRGVLKCLMNGSGRVRGSLLLFKPGANVMEERELVGQDVDLFNGIVVEGLGSIADRFCRGTSLQVLDNLDTEVFCGATPANAREIASVLLLPLGCDGLDFGAILVYSTASDRAFDGTEQEYWTTAGTLVGLSLHWHALRRKLVQQVS